VKRRRGRKDYVRWKRDRQMVLSQMDIAGGIFLADGSEVKIGTGVDDPSWHCVIASVVRRAPGRAVCLTLAARKPEQLRRFTLQIVGRPVLTDVACRNAEWAF
jgi:hypothetical protein